MPSASKVEYDAHRRRADLIVKHAGSLVKISMAEDKAILLHAALAAHVAAWDAYIKAVVMKKYHSVGRDQDAGYAQLRSIAEDRAKEAAKKLNTPNADNVRGFFLQCSQFDPWPNWANIKFGSEVLPSSLNVRERVDQVLKVRHSFSHGFPMPVFEWNQGQDGATKLNVAILKSVSGFFAALVDRTDVAYSNHISTTFAIQRPW
ncbi:MAG: hypothetical protein ACN6PQ_00485 [Stenotrophomonas indicatrix]|uniref:hypothetical protein n=1 Tax=Stenotrophomonas indicatrix TaxID=2045451 RepID=UPI003D1480E2